MIEKFTDYVCPSARFAPHRPRERGPREAYDALLEGLLKYRPIIRMPWRVARGDIEDTLEFVKADYPELFYVGSVDIVYVGPFEHPLSLTIRPNYRLGHREALAVLRAMVDKTDKVVREVCARRLPMRPGEPAREDYADDLRKLHDWLARCFTYADGERPYAHEAAGPLVYGLGVCEGAAKAMKFLCDRCGIACCVVSGQARGSADPAEAFGPHSWNLVRTRSGGGDVWTNVDVTFDAGISHGLVRHDYFGRTDAELADTHRRNVPSPLPPGTTSLDFYERTGRAATSARELARIIDRDWAVAGGTEFAAPACWESRDQLNDAIEKAIARSATFGDAAYPECSSYVLYPNYDLMVFGMEGVS